MFLLQIHTHVSRKVWASPCVSLVISEEPCRSRKPIPAAERLLVTLRYLATGVGRSTVTYVLPDIWRQQQQPVTGFTYQQSLRMSGTSLIVLVQLTESTSWWNALKMVDQPILYYKSFHSIVLYEICDAKYCSTFIDIGAYCGTNDASVLLNSALGQEFGNHLTDLNLPSPSSYKDSTLPNVLVGDQTFPLKPWLMKPYAGKNLRERERIYNYLLSRARRTIKNTFGIFSAKWRIYQGKGKCGFGG